MVIISRNFDHNPNSIDEGLEIIKKEKGIETIIPMKIHEYMQPEEVAATIEVLYDIEEKPESVAFMLMIHRKFDSFKLARILSKHIKYTISQENEII